MTVTEQSGIDLFGPAIPSLSDLDKLATFANSSEYNKLNFAQKSRNEAEEGNKLAGGIGLAIVGKYDEAIEMLASEKDSLEKLVILGRCYRSLKDFDKAMECFDKAAKLQSNNVSVAMEKVATFRIAGKVEDAEKELKACSNFEGVSAEYHYQLGKIYDANGDYDTANMSYQKAIELDDSHLDAMFQLAYNLDLRGDDESAIEYYQKIIKHTPARVNALMNLAILLEDKGEFYKAHNYVEMVNQSFPNNQRSTLFLKDIESSMTMYYDEEREKLKDRRNKVLEIPISDFELSVRSRNCLRKMNINTLGDLLKINENELLSYKNFGETSLSEIRQILESKGLRLGMKLDEEPIQDAAPVEGVSKEENETLAKTIEELELSVRAKRALDRLGIRTLGELVSKTEAELLGCKNFGITSLTEIKEKLTEYSLTMRKLD